MKYSRISTDDIVIALEKAFPKLKIKLDTANYNEYKTMMNNLTPFLAHYLGALSHRSDGHNGTNFVIEGCHFDFDKMLPILDLYEIKNLKEHFMLIGLVYHSQTPDELFDNIRKYDTEDEWTYDLNDDELKIRVIAYIEYSRYIYDKFQKYEPIIYDISNNREYVLDKIVDDIKSNRYISNNCGSSPQ